MRLYHYMKSGELVHRNGAALMTEARQDPMGSGFIIPANSTPVEPPVFPPKSVPVFRRELNKWEVVEDNRGIYYRKNDRSQVIFDTLGPVPEYLTDKRPTGMSEWDEGSETWKSNNALQWRIRAVALTIEKLAVERLLTDEGLEKEKKDSLTSHLVNLNKELGYEGTPKAP